MKYPENKPVHLTLKAPLSENTHPPEVRPAVTVTLCNTKLFSRNIVKLSPLQIVCNMAVIIKKSGVSNHNC